jgi:flagellar motility protein MotE (MotC chaperone)
LICHIIHSEDQPFFANHQAEAEKQLHSDEIEFRIIRKDGTVRWIGHVCQPVFDSDGNFLGTRASNRDLTKRKETEQKLKQLTEELKRYNVELQSVNDRLKAEIEVRERTQKALKLSEEQYKKMVDSEK